ncbi:hypothetical protein [Sphingobium yanoikuyae]|uniref:hypothetical protein n=1 Tax=Sphingobium yanoikuyae TaxID=13690 RepID=UPI0028AE758C|nr:hypothetical protein [Sphingobium yanoikuyae]
MSRTSDIFLIGSQAAKLGGFLPAWRAGHVHDIDLVTDEATARTIADTYGQPFAPHAPGSEYLSHPVKFDIDYAAMPERWALLDKLCPVAQAVPIAGYALPLRVAPVEVVWAIRAFTVGLTTGTLAKGVEDALWYDAQPKQITDDHMRLAHIYRRIGLEAAKARMR